jgi:hypothetical protein
MQIHLFGTQPLAGSHVMEDLTQFDAVLTSARCRGLFMPLSSTRDYTFLKRCNTATHAMQRFITVLTRYRPSHYTELEKGN